MIVEQSSREHVDNPLGSGRGFKVENKYESGSQGADSKGSQAPVQGMGSGIPGEIMRDKNMDINALGKLIMEGRHQEAMEALETWSQLGPEDAQKLRDWGRELINRQQFDAAVSVHRHLAQRFPQDTKALNALGVSLTVAQELDEALEVMKRAHQLAPQARINLLNLGKLHLLREEWSQALPLLQSALHKEPAATQGDIQEMINLCQERLAAGETDWNWGQTLGDAASQSAPPAETPAPPRVEPVAGAQPAATAAQTRPAPRQAPAAPALEPCSRLLNILFVQNSPCIRNYKMANALRARGHKVTLGYERLRLSQMYPGLNDDVYSDCIQIASHRQLWDLSKNFDIVHCHNEPDILTVSALAGQAPVVHDTHDLISLRAGGDPSLSFFEGVANRGAQGRVYSTPYQRREAEQLYGVQGPSLDFFNYVAQGDLPRRYLSKLSAKDGATHLVYEGGIGGNTHRDFTQLFVELASAGVHVHILPLAYNGEMEAFFKKYPKIHYYPTESPSAVMEVMTQFDFGIIPFNLEKGNRRFLDSTIANKLFEYLAAGLPVVASDIASYREFFAANPVGSTFQGAQDIIQGVPRLRQMAAETDFSKYIHTFEGEITRLEDFYFQLLDNWKPGGGQKPQQPGGNGAAAGGPGPSPAPQAGSESGPSTLQASQLSGLAGQTWQAWQALQAWVTKNGWAGYDPYDVRSHILHQRVKGAITPQQADEIVMREARDPLGVRQKLGITPQVNAKAMGLFLGSYAQLAAMMPQEDLSGPAEQCQKWLLENPSPGMSGLCWGYPFDWESVVIYPAGTPTGVNSYHVGDAFWQLYKNSGGQVWLERCLSISQFMSQDLNRDLVSDDSVCFSYTPMDFNHVHNANLCVAEFLIRVGQEAGRQDLVELGRKGVNFALPDLEEQGYLTYWAKGHEPSPANVGQMDHYHTAAELRSLHRLKALWPDNAPLAAQFRRYLEFYLANFFQDGAIPKMHPAKTISEMPFDIHAGAEAAYILGEVAPSHAGARETLERFLPWFLEHARNADGSFIYRLQEKDGQYFKNTFPFLRWGQAWTMRGLTSALAGLTAK